MFRTSAAILAIILGVLVRPVILPAADDEGIPEEPIILHALSLERDLDEKTVVGEGAVDLSYGDLRLRADKVVVNEETKMVIAEGNIILDEEATRLQGEHLEFNLDTRTGFIERGHGYANEYYFAGKRIEKLGPDLYRTEDGSFTTCEGTTPDWKFRTSEATVTVNKYATAWHPTMYLRKMPVLYLPYAAFPIKKERATGLLMPEFRINEIDGIEVRNAFFWAPRDNFDATVGLDYYENLGWGPGLEVRYIQAPGIFGRFDSFYIDEKDGGESWKIDFNHQHALPYGFRGQADIFVQSDRDYVKRFEDELELQAMEKTTSSFYLTRSWSHYDVVLSGLYEESLLTENESTITRFPELTIDRIQSRISDTGLFWRFSFEAANLRSENVADIFVLLGTGGDDVGSPVGVGDSTEGEVLLADKSTIDTTRFDILPEISWPKSLGGWGSITPSFRYRATYYSEDLEGDSHTRGIPSFDLSLEGPRTYRIFEPSQKMRIKHLIEPRVSFLYVPDEDQDTIPQFDHIDFIPEEKTLVYSLTNTVMGKRVSTKVGEKSRTRELLRVKLLQFYDFDARETGGEKRPFSPLEWDVRSSPTRKWDMRWRGDFNFYDSEVGFQDLSVTWRSLRGTTLRGEWRTSSGGERDFLDLWAQFPLGNLSWDLRSRYHVQEDEFIENMVAAKYSSQCWDVTVGYVQWPGEYEFRLQIGLKGIGNIINL